MSCLTSCRFHTPNTLVELSHHGRHNMDLSLCNRSTVDSQSSLSYPMRPGRPNPIFKKQTSLRIDIGEYTLLFKLVHSWIFKETPHLYASASEHSYSLHGRRGSHARRSTHPLPPDHPGGIYDPLSCFLQELGVQISPFWTQGWRASLGAAAATARSERRYQRLQSECGCRGTSRAGQSRYNIFTCEASVFLSGCGD